METLVTENRNYVATPGQRYVCSYYSSAGGTISISWSDSTSGSAGYFTLPDNTTSYAMEIAGAVGAGFEFIAPADTIIVSVVDTVEFGMIKALP